MANPTARRLIVDAYRASGLRSRTSEPSAVETATGLSMLNLDILDLIRNNRSFTTHIKAYTVTTVSGQVDYTIGEADPIPTNPQPDIVVNQDLVRIENMQVKVGSSWTPIEQMTPSDYYRTNVVEETSVVPSVFVFNRTRDPFDTISFTQGTLGGYELRIAVNGGIVNYELDDEIALPNGYYSYLKYAMAELLCLEAGLDETQMKMERKANQCLDRLEAVNAEMPPLLKTGGNCAQWNIGTDTIVNPGGL